MRAIPKNLQSNYFELRKSRLVSKGEIDEESISFFEYKLNKSLPGDEEDGTLYYIIKGFHYNDRHKLYNFLNNSKYECLLLYTDNVNIVKHFNLVHKLNINWDKNEKKYKCSKFVKREEHTEPKISEIEN